MSVQPLLPDLTIVELIRGLNERFRALDGSGSGGTAQNLAGTHAARLGLTPAKQTLGAFYVETDRGNLVYQIQNRGGNAWTYVGGTMTGTLSPDQRPTLSLNDAGFLFATTDTY